MERISVVGNTGSGKSTVAARLSALLGIPHTELDAIHHLPNWEPIDPDSFFEVVGEIASTDRWIIDGNYRTVVVDGPVWRRADTVVWLDFPKRTVMRQVTTRSVRRLLLRQELWNGNREPARGVLAWDPKKSIIRWAWTQHRKYEQRFQAAMANPELAHIRFVRLRSRGEVESWLRELSPGRGACSST